MIGWDTRAHVQTADTEGRVGPLLARAWAWARGHKKAAAGILLLTTFYALALAADFLSPNDYRSQARREPAAPPTAWHWRDAQGGWRWRPVVYPLQMSDPLARTYAEDAARPYEIELLARGYPYKLFGFIPLETHLLGVRGAEQADAPRLYFLGADALGRDRWARLLRAARFSLAVGPAGALLASLLGVLLGCVAGYRGGWVEALLMRAADTMMALPALVVILAARAAFPLELPPLRAGLLMVSIFALIGWAEMARLARGLVLELRQREFVTAARSLGLSESRILLRHILPNLARPLSVQFMLLLPTFLLAEIALSFLGVGLQEPEPSWGNMLAEANNITILHASPFVLLTPALAIFLYVLGVRLLGEGLETRS
jgi:peptide/nickel transport system permease protein